MRENTGCSWAGKKFTNFLKFIQRPHIKHNSWEFGKMRRVKGRSGAWGFWVNREN